MLLAASYVVNMLGGIAFIAVGVLLFALRPARAGANGFAMFAVAAGAQHFFGNLGSAAADESFGPLLAMLRLPFLLVAPTALVWGAAQFYGGRASWLIAPFVTIGGVGAILLLTSPALIVTPVGSYASLGEAVFAWPYFTSAAVASVLIVASYQRERSVRLRQELLLLLAATTPVLGYGAAFYAVIVWQGRQFFTTSVVAGYLVSFAMCLAAVAWVSALLFRSGERAARWLAIGSLAFIAVGALQSYLVLQWAQFGGLLRIFAAVLLGYALLKFHVFDIERGAWLAVRAGMVGGLILLGFTIASEIAETFIADRYSLSAGGAVVIAILLGLSPISRASEKLASRMLPEATPSAEYAGRRREDMYRACLDALMVDGRLDAGDRRTLDKFAQRVGLSSVEREAIEAEAQQRPLTARFFAEPRSST